MDNGACSYRRFLDGDDTGLSEIVKDYKDGLTLYLNGIVSNIFVAEELMEETKRVVKKAVDEAFDKDCDVNELKTRAKDALAKFVYSKTGRKPMILPITMMF
jgi:mRNA degradation ribonuclease J1/J2